MKKLLYILYFLIILLFSALHPTFAQVSPIEQMTVKLNHLAFKLYRQFNLFSENKIFSPYSISSLLGRLLPGTQGETHKQMMQLFELKNAEEGEQLSHTLSAIDAELIKLKPCFGWVNCKFRRLTTEQDFIIANAFWADKTFIYKTAFLEDLEQDKSVNFYVIDFLENPEAARKTINHWIENQTHQIIKNLLPSGSITSHTRLVLTNAVYFKGKWKFPFKAENTQLKPFTLPNHQQIQANMMMQTLQLEYLENEWLQVLKMPYNNTSLAMMILLPKKNIPLIQLVKKLNANFFNQLTQSFQEKLVWVKMPKFTIESQLDNLNDIISSMGLIDAFTERANFSQITNSKLILSKIFQKAYIQIDEEGTKAAASTSAVMTTTAVPAIPPKPIEFNANRPFLFLIYDVKTKVIVMIGQMVNP